MAIAGLSAYLSNDPTVSEDGHCELWTIERGFRSPGFWVALAAYARHQGVGYQQLRFSAPERHEQYCRAIRLPTALGEPDSYEHERINEGLKYSPLILLEDAHSTDRATSDVNGCIRELCRPLGVAQFTADLCEVVGDLHDNVWSHGKSTGFSMAQRWNVLHSQNHKCLEFALADCGIGFLRELHRVGLKVSSDEEAIDWCIQKGNSSKLVRAPQDDWAQWLPPDMMGNPIAGIGRVRESENHHQGLGLAKLVSLVQKYKGALWLASGNAILTINSNGRRAIEAPRFSWPGVALACRFDTGAIGQSVEAPVGDYITDQLITLLGEGS